MGSEMCIRDRLYVTYRIGLGLFESGHFVWLSVCAGGLIVSIASAVRDIGTGRMGWASRILLGAWGIVLVLLVIADLASTLGG